MTEKLEVRLSFWQIAHRVIIVIYNFNYPSVQLVEGMLLSGYDPNETHLSMFHSISNRAGGKRSRNSIFSVAHYAFNPFFSFEQETLRYSHYMIWLFFMWKVWLKSWMKIVESKDVLRIKRFLLKNCLQPKQYWSPHIWSVLLADMWKQQSRSVCRSLSRQFTSPTRADVTPYQPYLDVWFLGIFQHRLAARATLCLSSRTFETSNVRHS